MSKAENFDTFNAPQFFDFIHTTEHDGVDKYFETEQEPNKDPLEMEPAESSSSALEMELEVEHEEPESPDSFSSTMISENLFVPQNGHNGNNHNFRRSMSVGDLHYLQFLQIREPEISEDTEKIPEQHASNLRRMGSYASLNDYQKKPKENKLSAAGSSRTMSRESINRLAQPKRRHFASNQELSSGTYVPVAEYLNKFQNGTPERFRRKPKLDASNVQPKLKATVPQSPHLMAAKRNRPVTVLSTEQQENRDFDEAQKFKIKAHPVNKRILNGPLKPTVQPQKKPSTIPVPFKLTAQLKKHSGTPSKPEHEEFRAHPVPRSLHEPPKTKLARLPLTEPRTPTFMRRPVVDVEPKRRPSVVEEPKARPRTTEVLPFSFEMRDMCLRNKREKLIQKVLEEEKKAREFHARPLPKSILNSSRNLKHKSLQRSESQGSFTASDKSKSNDNLSGQFRARPATVLVKDPFVPKKTDKPLTEILQFNLNTEVRSKNREAFDKVVKEKEDQLALLKTMEENRRLQEEEEEKARLRTQTLYKAQPVKKYKELVIQPSGKVTEPVSPTFLTDKFHPKRDNKENVQ